MGVGAFLASFEDPIEWARANPSWSRYERGTMKLLRSTGLAALALAFSTLATNSVFADTVTMTSAPNRNNYGGGAFIATVNQSGQLGPAGSSFATFCIEENEFFSLGGTYTYTINPAGAVAGGVSGGNPDPISFGTAYLYSQYLDDPNHLTLTGDKQQGIQEAIWYLEGEAQDPGTFGGDVLTKAEKALGLTEAQMKLDCALSNCYGVVALNLTASDGNHQDMLGRVPEAGATLLLGMSLAGLAWVAYRKKLLPSGARPLSV